MIFAFYYMLVSIHPSFELFSQRTTFGHKWAMWCPQFTWPACLWPAGANWRYTGSFWLNRHLYHSFLPWGLLMPRGRSSLLWLGHTLILLIPAFPTMVKSCLLGNINSASIKMETCSVSAVSHNLQFLSWCARVHICSRVRWVSSQLHFEITQWVIVT